jgi:RNA 2',3'-cyclic 3'-phosphodiesterase
MTDHVRSFIACELPETVKSGLLQIQKTLQSVDPSCAKWVDPNSIHLTLKFLGNVDVEKIEPISKGLFEATRNIPPFQLELDELGAFPNLRRVQVVWIGVKGDLDLLQKLQNQIESRISPLGFPPENRAFKPHLTLARVRETTSPFLRQSLGEKLSQIKIECNRIIQVDSISLMRSQLSRTGAIYTRLCSAELTPSCQ